MKQTDLMMLREGSNIVEFATHVPAIANLYIFLGWCFYQPGEGEDTIQGALMKKKNTDGYFFEVVLSTKQLAAESFQLAVPYWRG